MEAVPLAAAGGAAAAAVPSRYVLIGSETGAPVYYDHREGRMLIPPMVTMQEVMEEMFGERAATMSTAEGRVFVTAKWQGYVLCLVDAAAPRDSVVLLRAQLYAIFRLLVLVFGPNALRTRQSPFFLRQRVRLQRLIDLSSHYFATEQSFLVRSFEQVDVNRDLARQCRLELQKVCKSLPGATHALLFAGTKLLSSFAKTDLAELHVQDLTSLLLYARSIFHPIERELDTDEPPVADYSDHSQFAASSSSSATNVSNVSTVPEESPEEKEALEAALADVSEIMPEEDEGPLLANHLQLHLVAEWLEHASRAAPVQLANSTKAFEWNDKEKNALASDLSFQLSTQHVSHLSSEAVAVLQLALWRAALFDEPIDGACSAPLLQSVISLQQMTDVAPPDGVLTRDTFRKLLAKMVRSPPVSIGGGGSGSGGSGEKNSSAEKSGGQRAAAVTASLFLRVARKGTKSPPGAEEAHAECRVHFAELESGLIVVLVCGTKTGDAEESVRLQRIEGYLRSRRSLGSYLSFFMAKERAPLSPLSYVHALPGLVHFLVTDRTNHRVLAPALGELSGQRFANRLPKEAEKQREKLRGHVWRLCGLANQLLASGGHSVICVRRGDFVYFFSLWVEEEGRVLPIDTALVGAGELSHDTSAYAALLSRTFPEKKNLRCFELYGLFLASLAAPTLKRYAELLVESLRQNFPTFFGKQ